MNSNSSKKTRSSLIDPARYGISFSSKQCRKFGLDPDEVLEWLLIQGWRRFRLMSYWDEHEKSPGHISFRSLDKHVKMIEKAGGTITMCVGAKQPRWPEYHWPEWAWKLSRKEREELLVRYLNTTVRHYRDRQSIVSWQLENEALLRGFGQRIEISRTRLQREHRLLKQLDYARPIVMSTSNGWGIPIRSPKADIVGFSYYLRQYTRGKYRGTIQSPWLHRLRRLFIWKPVFIHELQLEPWGPKDIWEMTHAEQTKAMNLEQITHNIKRAKQTGLTPIDLWGAEWWYWRHSQGDDSVWLTVQDQILKKH